MDGLYMIATFRLLWQSKVHHRKNFNEIKKMVVPCGEAASKTALYVTRQIVAKVGLLEKERR